LRPPASPHGRATAAEKPDGTGEVKRYHPCRAGERPVPSLQGRTFLLGKPDGLGPYSMYRPADAGAIPFRHKNLSCPQNSGWHNYPERDSPLLRILFNCTCRPWDLAEGNAGSRACARKGERARRLARPHNPASDTSSGRFATPRRSVANRPWITG